MIVVDTNIICYLYITGDFSEKSERLLEKVADWNAPVLWRSEFRSVISQYLRKNIFSLEEACVIIEQAEQLMHEHEFEVASSRVIELVQISDCSSYDCEFVALALDLNVPFVTTDKKILKNFPKIATSINAFLN